MTEGWHGDDYLNLFDENEASELTARYELSRWLPGFLIVGLKGWDDFILQGERAELATVPTVPIASEHLAPLGFAIDPRKIKPDERFTKRIKWYTKPIVFGGDPASNENIVWVTLEQHVQLVKWWNDLYWKMK
jgi:hypothetical protein